MEKQNITPQNPETIEVASNIGACFVIDDNLENKDGEFDVASDETLVDQEMYSSSDSAITKDRIDRVASDFKLEDDIKEHPATLKNSLNSGEEKGFDLAKNELKDSADRSAATDGSSDDRYVMSKLTACAKPQKKRDGRFHKKTPSDKQSGYEGDVDSNKDGESSGNVTDSDSETKKTLAENSKHVIQKAIERLDSIKEDLAEVDAEKRSEGDDDDEYEEDIDDEPGSSCVDTMVSEYGSTDLEQDTDIPKHVLYKLLGREDKPRPEKRKGSKNAKRKLSAEDA